MMLERYLGSFWAHFGLILGSFWAHSGLILGSFWAHSGLILGSFWALNATACLTDHFSAFMERVSIFHQLIPAG